MKKWNLIFDVSRCNSCNNCVLATKDEYLGNEFSGYSKPAPRQGGLWLTLSRHERGAHPMIDVSHYIKTCQQCDNAPCINAETKGVVSKRDDGIVVIDPDAAKGRKDLVDSCPYGQIFWNDALNVPQKWSFDAHLIDGGWNQPRCAQVCPTEALTAVKITDEDMQRRVQEESLVNLKPELGAKPRIWYKNFDRVTHCFLGGSVVKSVDGIEDCAEGIEVRLSLGNQQVAVETTDAFGDFKFDRLRADDLAYRITVVDNQNSEVAHLDVMLDSSKHVGVINI